MNNSRLQAAQRPAGRHRESILDFGLIFTMSHVLLSFESTACAVPFLEPILITCQMPLATRVVPVSCPCCARLPSAGLRRARRPGGRRGGGGEGGSPIAAGRGAALDHRDRGAAPWAAHRLELPQLQPLSARYNLINKNKNDSTVCSTAKATDRHKAQRPAHQP